MHPDSVEMLSVLSAAGVDFIIVGAHALAAHGIPRATGDLDIWVPITGVTFDEAWPRRLVVEVAEGPHVPISGAAISSEASAL
jgi:hypothetical protein